MEVTIQQLSGEEDFVQRKNVVQHEEVIKRMAEEFSNCIATIFRFIFVKHLPLCCLF